jgi:hypothetical protein
MIKTNFSVFCGFLLSVACSTEKPQPQIPTPAATTVVTAEARDSTPLAKVSDSSQATGVVNIDAEEAVAIRPVTGIVTRVGTDLRIRLLNGTTAILKDDTTAGMAFALPRYAEYLRTIHSHVIHQYQYEGEGIYLVVDDSTGDSTIVYGMPVASPDGNRFAFASMEGMEGGNPGVIEVWRMDGRNPEKEFSYDTEHEPWEASDIVWRDSVTIDFFKNTHSSPDQPYVQTPGHLKRTGTTWVLLESPNR